MSKLYFVIDTEQYAGSFVRELCAWVTGMTGECEVGKTSAERALEQEPELEELLDDVVGQEPDEHGCYRPCVIWTTPGWFNNGHGGHFREDPANDEAALAARDKSVRDYAENTIRRCYEDKDYGNKQADAYLAENLGKPLMRCGAYQSVAIVVNDRPEQAIIDLLKRRALSWDGVTRMGPGHKPTITGFRLVTVREIHEEEAL
jgi:hypothetical protein